MLWFILSLTAAFTQALNDTLSKRFFGDMTPFQMGLTRLLYALPYLALGLYIVPRPSLDRVFWLCIFTALPLELAAFLLYMRAIKVSPLSLTLPFLAFTPAFMILTGSIILDEYLNILGLAGVIIIVLGAYLMNFAKIKDEWTAPLKAILKEQGSWLMLIVAFLYSLTSTIGKLAILHSSPQFFAFTYFLLFTLIVLCICPVIPGVKMINLIKRPAPAAMSGLVLAAMIFSHTLALSMVQAAYMISVKRTSIIFGVLLGALVFREKEIKQRLFGASVMLAGVIIIGLFG